MKCALLSILFISSFHTFNLLSEEQISIFELRDDMNRVLYTLKSNKNYKFINSCNDKIYFIEIQDDIIIYDSKDRALKNIVCLTNKNKNVTIYKKDEFKEKEIIAYVTSVKKLQIDVRVNIIKNLNTLFTETIYKTLMNIIYINEDEDQIIKLNSIENSVLFSF